MAPSVGKLLLCMFAVALFSHSVAAIHTGRSKGALSTAPPEPQTFIRWFNMLKWKPDQNITFKAEAVDFAVRKCSKWFVRAVVGKDLGYGPVLYNHANMDVISIMDFANVSDIVPFDKCIDENNPVPGAIKDGLVGFPADFGLETPVPPNKKSCNYFPGCTGNVITQVQAWKVANFSNANVSRSFLSAFQKTVKATRCLTTYAIGAPDSPQTPLPPFLKLSFGAYSAYDSLPKLRAAWALLQGQPGEPLAAYKTLEELKAPGGEAPVVQFKPLTKTIKGEKNFL